MPLDRRDEAIVALTREVRALTQAVTAGERRIRTLERAYRRVGLFMIAALLVGGYLAYGIGSAVPAAAEGRSGGDEPTPLGRDVARLERWASAEHARFDAAIERLRSEAGQEAAKLDPAHAVAVMLKDMRDLLMAMPEMARDMNVMTQAMQEMNAKMTAMPAMAADMHQMNLTMGIMSRSVDSTMGRMGRMLPWP